MAQGWTHPPHPRDGLQGKPSTKNTVVGALALAACANSSSGGTYSLATTPLLSPLLSAVEGSSAPRFMQRQPKTNGPAQPLGLKPFSGLKRAQEQGTTQSDASPARGGARLLPPLGQTKGTVANQKTVVTGRLAG